MVRPDEKADLPCQGPSRRLSGCTFPAGESPVPVSAEAPGSRSQAEGENPLSQAGCQKPGIQSGEQASRPQHQVNLAASTEKQWKGRAAHVTAKATFPAVKFGAIHAENLPGVGRAACLQGKVRNRRDPSAPSVAGQSQSYKPEAKASGVQRESERVIVPLRAVRQNAAGGKDPWEERGGKQGKREGMLPYEGANHPLGCKSTAKVRELGNRLWVVVKPSLEKFGGGIMQHQESSSVSRVREIRMHGLIGGSTRTLPQAGGK
jgi:hypothetical protein